MDFDDIRTPGGVRVPASAVSWRFSRSSAPGGQHVNTSSTRVELRCDVTMLDTSDATRTRLVERLGPVARVTSSEERSQRRNREQAVVKLCSLIDAAAAVEIPRRATRPTRGSVQRRLAEKDRRSQRKSDRGWRHRDET
jgi:ribosome-associated protein